MGLNLTLHLVGSRETEMHVIFYYTSSLFIFQFLQARFENFFKLFTTASNGQILPDLT